MNNLMLIIITLLLIIIYLIYNKKENFDSSGISFYNEAIQNISSIYNNKNMSVTNLNITGNLKIGNYIFSTDNSGNLNIKDASNNYFIMWKNNKMEIRNSTILGTTNISGTVIGGTYTNPNIYHPQVTGGFLKGSGLMDPSGRFGLFANTVWNNKYGIRMYDTNSDGKWENIPTRIHMGQIGYGNAYLRPLFWKTNQTPNGNDRGGARFYYIGTNDTSDPETPISTQFFGDYIGEQTVAGD